jgi:nitrous oxidase accessory protein NosD
MALRKNICWIFGFLALAVVSARGAERSVADYASIQAALDANPGEMMFLPAGDYPIDEKIRIRGDRSGLFGPGRVIQRNPGHPVIEIENAAGAELRDLTLTRPETAAVTDKEGIIAIQCRDLVVDNVRVIDNQTRSGAITLRECNGARVSHCLVRNYMRVTVDDRTASLDWGYAFNCTDGSGINLVDCKGASLEGNRIIEEHLRPTPEIKESNQLGVWVKKNPVKGRLLNQQTWDAGYTDNWQQGSGIVVNSPAVADLIRITGNQIENAAQGIDIHADHVIVSGNVIVNSFMGMKAMHGSRNVLIQGNQFVRNSLWAIGLMPGAAANAENSDGRSIVSNNIISEFGKGDASWIWGTQRSPFKFEKGQQPDDPPLTEVIVQGNLIDSSGPPLYKYAVVIEGGPNTPRGLYFSDNLLAPGTAGVANIELPQLP